MISSLLHVTEILVSPESANVINGDSVVFQCIARADNVIFFVNGTLAAEQIVVDKGFNEMSIMEVNETTKNRTLTATALTQYNNTTIICSASIIVNLISNGTVLSDPAILHVQGNNNILVIIMKQLTRTMNMKSFLHFELVFPVIFCSDSIYIKLVLKIAFACLKIQLVYLFCLISYCMSSPICMYIFLS